MQQQLKSPEGIADNDLVRQALAGNHMAFEALVQRYTGMLLQCIFRYMRDSDQTYDVLQQVLLQLYRHLPTLKLDRPLKPWLMRVAHNCCIDELRKRQRRRVISFSDLEVWNAEEDIPPLAVLADPHPLPEERAEYADLLDTVERAIETLPPIYRSVVLLRCTEDLPFSKIAQTLQMPEATAKTYFYRARLRLRAALVGEIH